MEGFKKRGLGVAALSYDSPEVLKDFASRRHITYPLLSDPESYAAMARAVSPYGDGHAARRIADALEIPRSETLT